MYGEKSQLCGGGGLVMKEHGGSGLVEMSYI